MDMSVIMLCISCIIIIAGLLNCFFGYKLSRLLYPLAGLFLLEIILYVYVYELLKLDDLGTWLFFGGSGIVLYIAMFFLRRIAGFFTGLLGGALFLAFIVNAFGLQQLDYIYPACFAISLVSGLLTVIYDRTAAIIFTSIFGSCAAVFTGLYLYTAGPEISALTASGNILATLQEFLSANALVVAGASFGIAASGILIQFAATANSRVLPGGNEKSNNAAQIKIGGIESTAGSSGNQTMI